CRPVAEPPATRFDVDALRSRELGAGFLDVAPERVGRARHAGGIDQAPAVRSEHAGIRRIRVLDVERDLERVLHALGDRREAPELVRLLTVEPPVRLDAAVGAAPAGDGPEAFAVRALDRPLVEHDRRSQWSPANPVHGQRAIGTADVLAERVMEVVAVQSPGKEAVVVPELCVGGVVVQVDLHARSTLQLRPRQVATDVEQQCRRLGAGDQLIGRRAREEIAVDVERGANTLEVLPLGARYLTRLFDECDVETQPPQPDHERDARPGVAAVRGLAAQHAGDDRTAPRPAQLSTRSRSAPSTLSESSSLSASSRAAGEWRA